MAAPARRDLGLEAGELEHFLFHKPANPHCASCTRGRLRNAPHISGRSERAVESWGDVIMLDHMIQTDEAWNVGLGNSRQLSSIKDVATGLKGAFPCLLSRRRTRPRPSTSSLVPGAPIASTPTARRSKVAHETSQPVVPQSGIIERANGDILAMARTVLVHAGLSNYL